MKTAQRYTKPPIKKWLTHLPGLSPSVRDRILEDNEEKAGNLRRLGLPTDTDFGTFDSPEEMAAAVPDDWKGERLFIIRCPHRFTPDVKRALFITWSEVLAFVDGLPGGYGQYHLGLREVATPLWSGTIISSDRGKSVMVELWKGKHLEMDMGNAFTSFRGSLGGELDENNPTPPWRYVWSKNCTQEAKLIMLGAIRMISRDLRPKESMFVEFSLTNRGYRFIGASFDSFWTEKNSLRSPKRPDGD